MPPVFLIGSSIIRSTGKKQMAYLFMNISGRLTRNEATQPETITIVLRLIYSGYQHKVRQFGHECSNLAALYINNFPSQTSKTQKNIHQISHLGQLYRVSCDHAHTTLIRIFFSVKTEIFVNSPPQTHQAYHIKLIYAVRRRPDNTSPSTSHTLV